MKPVSIEELIESKPPKNDKFYLVAIDGRGGSGKTSLTKYLSRLLREFTVINGDDYFEPDDTTIAFGSFNDARFFNDVINPLQRTKTIINFRPYDWDAKPPITERKLHITSGLIIERCFSFAFKLDWDFKIWIDAPKDLALHRGIERDKMPKEEVIRLWEELWQPKEDNYIKDINPLQTADLVIDGTKSFEQQII
jgi:uridine kinase